MIKKTVIAMSVVACLFLTGCDNGKKANVVSSDGVAPSMTIYGTDWTGIYFTYAVDENTKTVYILGSIGDLGFMSVALNPDGTPVTKEQLHDWQRTY